MSKIEERRKEVRRLVKEGWTQKEIAKAFRVSCPTINRDVRELNLRTYFSRKISSNRLAEMQKACDRGYTAKDVAAQFGVSRSYIYQNCVISARAIRPLRTEQMHDLLQFIDKVRIEQGLSSEDLAAKIGRSESWWRVFATASIHTYVLQSVDKLLEALGYELRIRKVQPERLDN